MKCLNNSLRTLWGRLFLMFLAGFLLLGIDSCKSGGGSSDEESVSNTPALIDESNAVELTANAYSSRDLSPNSGNVFSAQTAASTPLPGIKDLCRIGRSLADLVQGNDIEAVKSLNPASTVSTSTITHDCPNGSQTVVLSINTDTGEVSGTITSTNYISQDEYYGEDTVESGIVAFSGRLDLTCSKIASLDLSFDAYELVGGSESVSLSGNMSITFQIANALAWFHTMALNVVASDEASGESIELDNVAIGFEVNILQGYFLEEMSGRFIDSRYGYIDLSTTEAFHLGFLHHFPSSGCLVVTGAPGEAGGNTSACLTALSSTTFTVDADTDGDGIYDWHSEALNWSEF